MIVYLQKIEDHSKGEIRKTVRDCPMIKETSPVPITLLKDGTLRMIPNLAMLNLEPQMVRIIPKPLASFRQTVSIQEALSITNLIQQPKRDQSSAIS